MATKEELAADNHMLRERLRQLSEASMRFNESLDYTTVLQGVIDSSRSLTGARYGGMFLYDETGWIADYVSSGPTAEEAHLFCSRAGTMAAAPRDAQENSSKCGAHPDKAQLAAALPSASSVMVPSAAHSGCGCWMPLRLP